MTIYRRNLKSLDNKTGRKIKAHIADLVANSLKYKSCYFWSNTGDAGNAASRRRQGFQTELSFILNGHKYAASQDLSISCRNFYFSTGVQYDGHNSNMTRLKNLID